MYTYPICKTSAAVGGTPLMLQQNRDAQVINTALPLALTVTASGIKKRVMPLSILWVTSQATIISGIATALKVGSM